MGSGPWVVSLSVLTPFYPSRSPLSSQTSAAEMEREQHSGSKELSAATAYRCSACDGAEDWAPGHPVRGRPKCRSLSASPALAGTKEFR